MYNNFLNDKRNLILLIGAILYFIGMVFNISWLKSLILFLTVLLYFYSLKLSNLLYELGIYKSFILILSFVTICLFTAFLFISISSNFKFNKLINYLIITTVIFSDTALLSLILNKLKDN
ncbi:Uncharacterised protein [Clostridium perfringens]|uniref:Uncharacterized protein n=1 Tax=Clostridium perfringens TaxID=1502 RepID=A0A2X2YAT3_CLOPF|nr:hypothetical protein C8114_00205 [Clostridium perfringens]SQB60043.1 Uncharacterised protein [Clostridium perfringens]